MKILIDGRFWGLENGGLGRYTMNLVKNLSKIDTKNEYTLLLRKKHFDEVALLPNWKKVLGDVPHYGIREQVVLPKIISTQTPDLVHFLHFNTPVALRLPYLVTIHDMLMHKQKGFSATTLNPASYLVKRLGYAKVFSNSVKKAKRIIVPSNFVKGEIIKKFKVSEDKLVVTYEGVDDSLLGAKVDKTSLAKLGIEAPYFLYVGNAYPHKNLGRLIEAVSYLNKSLATRCNLVIVTSRGVFKERLAKVVEKYNAKSLVRLFELSDDSVLATLYSEASAFVFPSLSEGFGLPGLEAMSFGTPVLASDISVFREVYKKEATYFNPFDFTSIVNAMQEALRVSPQERLSKAKKLKEVADSYSWERLAKETLKVYESVL